MLLSLLGNCCCQRWHLHSHHLLARSVCPRDSWSLGCFSLPAQQMATEVFVVLPVQCCRADFWGNKQVPRQSLICSAGIWSPPLGQSAVVWEGHFSRVLWSSDSLRTRGIGHQQGHPVHVVRQEVWRCTGWCQRWQPWPSGAYPWGKLLIVFFFGYAPSLLTY